MILICPGSGHFSTAKEPALSQETWSQSGTNSWLLYNQELLASGAESGTEYVGLVTRGRLNQFFVVFDS